MNRRPLLSARDEAFIYKWRWRLAAFYSAVILSIVLDASATPKTSADQGFSAAAIGTDRPIPR